MTKTVLRGVLLDRCRVLALLTVVFINALPLPDGDALAQVRLKARVQGRPNIVLMVADDLALQMTNFMNTGSHGIPAGLHAKPFCADDGPVPEPGD